MVLTLGATRATYAAPSVRHQCVAGDSSSGNNSNNNSNTNNSGSKTDSASAAAAAAGLSITSTSTSTSVLKSPIYNTATTTTSTTTTTTTASLTQQQAPVMSSKVSRLLINLNCLGTRNEESVRQDSRNHPSSPPVPPGPASTNDADKPQPCDVVAWNESFDNLLHSKKGRQIFQNFLKQEFSDENLLFWIACEELKSEKNKDAIEERARMIYEDFISVLSPKEVSLDARVREQVNRAMVEPRANIFDEAQLQVYMLMKRDSYPRFISSPVYKKLMQDAGKGSSSQTAATSSRAGAAAGSPESLTTS